MPSATLAVTVSIASELHNCLIIGIMQNSHYGLIYLQQYIYGQTLLHYESLQDQWHHLCYIRLLHGCACALQEILCLGVGGATEACSSLSVCV